MSGSSLKKSWESNEQLRKMLHVPVLAFYYLQ